MNDTHLSRKRSTLSDISQTGDLLLFCDQQQDGITVTGANIQTSSFLRLGLKEAVFADCSFTQSNFEDSYFRKAKFRNVRFTGSSFKFCNFDKASFQACDFRYCKFYHCKLPIDEIIACLPTEPNLRRDLARNLRANFELLADKKSADTFLDIEIQASEEELKAILLSKTEYYKGHYNFVDQINAGFKFLLSKFSGIIWGYGHRVSRLLISYFVITCLCCFVTYFGKLQFSIPNHNIERPLTFWESIYHGFSETVGASGLSIVPAAFASKIMILSQSFIGTIFLALLAATIYRRIAR